MHSLRDIDDYIKTQAAKLPPDRLIFVPKVYSTRLNEHRYPDRYELDRSGAESARRCSTTAMRRC